MVVIHKALRREFSLMPTLVAAVADGDLSRAATIAEHAQLSLRFLHEHHNSEDRLIWPILQERVPLEERLIELMKRQHQSVDDLIALITPKLVAWSETADTRTRELIAARLTELDIALDEHLVREETDVLPLIHENLSVAEWNASEDEAVKNGPRSLSAKLLLAGMVLEDANPAEHAVERARPAMRHGLPDLDFGVVRTRVVFLLGGLDRRGGRQDRGDGGGAELAPRLIVVHCFFLLG